MSKECGGKEDDVPNSKGYISTTNEDNMYTMTEI